MSNVMDVGIIGAGVAGAFACYKIAKDHKNVKVILFDIGRPPAKRRAQMVGWFGLFPNSDGKLFLSDIPKVSNITGLRKAKSAFTYLKHVLGQIDTFKVIKDRSPSVSMDKKLKKYGYDVILNDYMQMYPKEIHKLSKYMADTVELNKNITFSFDSEVVRVVKQKNMFVVSTTEQEYRCKKLIIAAGRSGWRWTTDLYNSFGIVDNNDIARFGIKIEANATVMKELNRSCCTLTKNNDIEVGPFSWYGTVIPEDHLDMAISAFRSNEARWESNKVSFNLIGNRPFPNKGFEQTDRIGKLMFVLSNDRIIKERISSILTGKSKVSMLHEYGWLKDAVTDLANVIPEVLTKAYFHVPTIVPLAPSINIGDNLETEIDGMFVAGEATGVRGILTAGLTGIIAGDAACK